jgi:hypothetical protein
MQAAVALYSLAEPETFEETAPVLRDFLHGTDLTGPKAVRGC